MIMGWSNFSIQDTFLSLSARYLQSQQQQPPRQQQPRPSSDIWDLVVDRDWNGVRRQIDRHPEDVRYMDGHYRETVLYLVMQQHNPPLDVVQRMVDVYPAALVESCTKNHDYPLHIACSFDVDPSIIKLLVGSNPATAVLQTRWGKTPLVALWELRQKQNKLRRQHQQHQRRQRRPEEDIDNDGQEGWQEAQPQDIVENETIDGDDAVFWEKVEIILRGVALYRRSLHERGSTKSTACFLQDDNSPSFIVHAAVSLGSFGCPFPILECVVGKYPEQVQTKDEHGLLPLHICIGPSQWTTASIGGVGSGGQRKYRPREGDVIKLLLKTYPSAAKVKMQIRREPRRMETKYSTRNRWHLAKIKEVLMEFIEYLIHDETSLVQTNASKTTRGGKEKVEEEEKMPTCAGNAVATATATSKTGERDSPSYWDSSVYPLQYALMNRHWWNDGIKEVIQAFPDALKIRDPSTQLYAFQLAAMLPTSTACITTNTSTKMTMMDPESSVDLETVYQLLRMDPNILDRLIVPQPSFRIGTTHTYTCNIQ